MNAKTRKELDELRELDKDTKDLQELRDHKSTKYVTASNLKRIVTGTVDELEEEYLKWAREKSTHGYVFGWHRSHVFEFLREKYQ